MVKIFPRIPSLSLDPRALPLLLGLMLIGGTACFSLQQTTSPEEIARIQAQQREIQRAHVEKLEHDAGAGDLAAATNLAHVYLYGTYGATRNAAKARELLERAAAASYAPAQADLGWILLAGRTSRSIGQVEGLQSELDPERGMALLKASLPGTTCIYLPGPKQEQSHPYLRPGAENDIAEIYREGKLVPRDIALARLWLARSLIHCRYPTAIMLATPERYGIAASPIDRLAWLLLLPPSPQLEAARSAATPEDMQAAQLQAAAFRTAVAESEKQYPAPH